jgi:hypothetical protein
MFGRERGASTLEVMAALVLFACAAAGLAVSLPMAFGRLNHWRTELTLARDLENRLEDLAATSFPDIPIIDSGWQTDGDLEYRQITVGVRSGVDSNSRPTWEQLFPDSGNGLMAAYYNNPDFSGTTVTRIDSTVNFNWGRNAPAPSIGNDSFSVRWTGYLEIPVTGNYTFFTRADDGSRLWVNEQLVINEWEQQNGNERSGSLTLSGGSMVPIRMEMNEDRQNALAQLSWQGSSIPKQIIAQRNLYTDLVKMTTITVRLANDNSQSLTGRSICFATEHAETTPGEIVLEASNTVAQSHTNTLYPWFKLTNSSSETLDLSNITIRYYFKAEGNPPQQNYNCDHAGINAGNTYRAITSSVSGIVTRMIPSAPHADYYLEVQISNAAGSLPPDGTVEIQGRVWQSDWSNYNQNNDYSFTSSSNYIIWDKVTVYQNGALIWGVEPR